MQHKKEKRSSPLSPAAAASKPAAAPKEQPDVSKMTPEEQQIFQKYGKLPNKKDLAAHKLKERKYFDSGDYALYKAGNKNQQIGSVHPSPDMIPHSSPQNGQQQLHPKKQPQTGVQKE